MSAAYNDIAGWLVSHKEDTDADRGVIILCAETPKDSSTTRHIISLAGEQIECAKCVADLATNSETQLAFKLGMLAAAKSLKSSGIHILTI